MANEGLGWDPLKKNAILVLNGILAEGFSSQ